MVHVADGFDWFWITPKGVGFRPRTVLAVSSWRSLSWSCPVIPRCLVLLFWGRGKVGRVRFSLGEVELDDSFIYIYKYIYIYIYVFLYIVYIYKYLDLPVKRVPNASEKKGVKKYHPLGFKEGTQTGRSRYILVPAQSLVHSGKEIIIENSGPFWSLNFRWVFPNK